MISNKPRNSTFFKEEEPEISPLARPGGEALEIRVNLGCFKEGKEEGEVGGRLLKKEKMG